FVWQSPVVFNPLGSKAIDINLNGFFVGRIKKIVFGEANADFSIKGCSTSSSIVYNRGQKRFLLRLKLGYLICISHTNELDSYFLPLLLNKLCHIFLSSIFDNRNFLLMWSGFV